MPDVQQLLKSGAALTDHALERLLPGPEVQPHSIHRAMRHSTFAGGKRLRPILALEAARLVAGDALDARAAAELGAALEMLHTYSLIHDDLPALDNDDLRRGQPTCHVVFGEATAILAGDALQTLAFQTIARLPVAAHSVVHILREISDAISTGVGADLPGGLPPGMIGGQVMDLEGEGVKPTAELVERIHRAKTGALITVSVVAGGYLAAAPEDTIARLRTFGQKKPASPSRSSTTSSTSRRIPPSSARPPARTPRPTRPPGPPFSASTKACTTPKSSSPTPSPRSSPSAKPPPPLKALATYLTTRKN